MYLCSPLNSSQSRQGWSTTYSSGTTQTTEAKLDPEPTTNCLANSRSSCNRETTLTHSLHHHAFITKTAFPPHRDIMYNTRNKVHPLQTAFALPPSPPPPSGGGVKRLFTSSNISPLAPNHHHRFPNFHLEGGKRGSTTPTASTSPPVRFPSRNHAAKSNKQKIPLPQTHS